MPRLPETFNVGDDSDVDIPEVLAIIQRMYTDLAVALNQKPDLVQRMVDGQPNDGFLDQGTLNINLSTNKVEMLTNHTGATSVTWTQLS